MKAGSQGVESESADEPHLGPTSDAPATLPRHRFIRSLGRGSISTSIRLVILRCRQRAPGTPRRVQEARASGSIIAENEDESLSEAAGVVLY